MRNKLEAVYASGQKAEELVSQILTFSRKDEQVRSPIELNLIVEDALKLLHHAIPSTIQIQTEIEDNCRMVGDPSRINKTRETWDAPLVYSIKSLAAEPLNQRKQLVSAWRSASVI